MTTILNNPSSPPLTGEQASQPSAKTPTNTYPLVSGNSPPGKSKKKVFIGGLIVFLVLIITLPILVYQIKNRQEIRQKAAGPSISCEQGQYGLLVVRQFKAEEGGNDACASCAGSDCSPQSVGQLDVCNRSGTSCIPLGKCPDDSGCTFTPDIPTCSVLQLDCLNNPYPNASIVSGARHSNCGGACLSQVTPTPTPTPAATPTPGPTATPTPGPTASPTPTPAATPTPGPTATPTPGPTATPTPLPTPTPTPGTPSTPGTEPTPKVPVSGAGPSVLGASAIAGGLLLLLLGLAL